MASTKGQRKRRRKLENVDQGSEYYEGYSSVIEYDGIVYLLRDGRFVVTVLKAEDMDPEHPLIPTDNRL